MVFTFGYAQFGEWRGVPLRWHASLLLGLVAMAGFELAPWRWLFAFGLLIAHAAGHALMARRFGLRVVGIDLQGVGGEVRHAPTTGPDAEAAEVAVAWGGMLAQLAVYLVVRLGLAVFGPAEEVWSQDLTYVATTTNLVVIAVHLLPLPTFDGATAWRIIALQRGRQALQQRMVQVHFGQAEVAPEELARVRSEVEAELEAITRAHNARADETR